MELIAEFAAPQMSFFFKAEKPRERMGCLALIQFTTHPAAKLDLFTLNLNQFRYTANLF